ncbi:hypothetical protein LCGC14_0981310 [marine sediment metagenome]|uniref:Uncharacterized protein n=1 Tax=marine sediment metagenome TaxID=412755 RepID=A0A0F9RFA3_9ZZZZ
MSLSAIQKMNFLQQMKITRRGGAAVDWTAGANFNIFQVQGDAVLVVNLFGIVTTLMGAGAAVPQYTFTPTGGAAVGMSAAMATIATDVAGSVYVWDGVTATIPAPAAQIGWADSAEAGWNGDPGILPVGIIRITNAVVCDAGVVDYYICYIPCSPGSQVIAL